MNKKEIRIGNVVIGGNNKIAIQSMCTVPMKDTENCIKQILELEKAGCEIIRCTVKDELDAYAIPLIKKAIHIPLIADIHFDYNLGILAIENGVDKIRFNPGNIGSDEKLKKLIDKCIEKDIPVRVGVNSGSIEKKYQNSGLSLVDQALMSLKYHVELLEEYGFTNMVLSIKLTNVKDTIKAYEKASEMFNYPLHIGLTESGYGERALVKSSVCLGALLSKGIGDTIRVSLTGNPVNEIYAAKNILRSLNLIEGPNLISCPTCGRTEVNLEVYAKEMDEFLKTINKNINVAVMGCLVNGPGEAKEADLGIAFYGTTAMLFKNGEPYLKGNAEDMVKKLKEEILDF